MIGKIPRTGRGFRGSFNYLMRGKRDDENPERLAWMETRNLFVNDREKIPRMMRATASQSLRCQKPVYHFLISWREDEAPADQSMREIADQALADMGLTEHQAVLAAHRDTSHRHVHILVNRVHPETGKAWHTGKDWERLERSIARQALERGFIKVDGRHNTPEKMARADKRARDSEFQMSRREGGVPLDRWSLQEIKSRRHQLSPIFDQARSWDHLERLLSAEGLTITRKGQGLVIDDGLGFMKLSDLGKDVRLKGLEGLYSERFADFDRRRDERGPLLHQSQIPQPQPAQPAPDQISFEISQDQHREAWRQRREGRAGARRKQDNPSDQDTDNGGAGNPVHTAQAPMPPILRPHPIAPEVYERVRDARARLDMARHLHKRGQIDSNDLIYAIDTHAEARDALGKMLEQVPDKATLRDQWRQQSEAMRQAAEVRRLPQRKPASSSGATSSSDSAAVPPQRTLPTNAPHQNPPQPSPRHEAFKHLSHAYAHMDLAQQLHGLGVLSKQDLMRARADIAAAREELAKHQTFGEFVGDGVRETLASFNRHQPKPSTQPTRKLAKPTKPQSKSKWKNRNREDNDHDR